MATKRLSMRNVREILRMKWLLRRSHRDIAKSLEISAGSVGSVVARAKAKGLSWAAVKVFKDDDRLEQLLYGPRGVNGTERPEPDCAYLHTELRRPGVTLELLHVEYLETHPQGYRYSAFCARYKQWKKLQRRSMRQVHKAGEKAFVDYSGKKPQIVDPKTGEVSQVELFVAVLGASNLCFAEATLTQKSRDWIASNTRALEYFGGVPAVVVPDQLKSGVTRSCRYEPGIQRTFEDWSEHMGTVIIPARPRKPKDKAKVEVGVQIVQRWILAKIRNETFFSLEALNDRIAELLEELNDRPMRSYGGRSRRQLFEHLEQSVLKPLPAERFVYVDWLEARVSIDYHVEVDKHFYSVPHTLGHHLLDVRLSATTVDVLLNNDRVWLHRRSYLPGRHTTVPEHMPKSHQAHLEWSPSRLIHWGGTVGPQTAKLVKQIMQSRPHPEQGYRSCLGLMRLSKLYGSERFEAAAARAIAAGATSYRHVDSILKHGMDRLPVEPASSETKEPISHDNLRGADYYKSKGDD
jgi:transposase